MTESQFLELVDVCLTRVEDAFEASAIDHDCSRTGKVLTIDLEGLGQVVINAQAAVQELWMASKLGAYHFKWTPVALMSDRELGQEGRWMDTRSALSFSQVLARDVQQLAGRALHLK